MRVLYEVHRFEPFTQAHGSMLYLLHAHQLQVASRATSRVRFIGYTLGSPLPPPLETRALAVLLPLPPLAVGPRTWNASQRLACG
jgi:hypothetical protein